MGGSASTRRIAPRANQPPCLLEPVTAEVCKLAGAHPLRHGVVLSLVPLRLCVTSANAEPEPTP